MHALVTSLLIATVPWDAAPTVPVQWLGSPPPARVARPARIVTLAPSATEFVAALGAADRLVAVSRYCDRPQSVLQLPKAGGFLDPNVEAVLSHRPQLVVAVANGGNRAALDRIAGLGVPVLAVPGNSFADTFHAGRAIAQALGGDAPKRGAALLKNIRAEIAALRDRHGGGRSPRVLFVYDHRPMVVAGPGSFADTILQVLNATNVVKIASPYPQYAVEQVIADRPDVILDVVSEHVSAAGGGDFSKFTTIPAVRDGRVHRFAATSTMRAGPRLASAVRLVASYLYKGVDDQSAGAKSISKPSTTGVSRARPSSHKRKRK